MTPRRLFTAILFVALFVMATREIADPDFWWHLRTGQFIVDTGSIPHGDIFSYTNAGQPWITHEWLSEVIIHGLYRLGSFPLLILAFSGVITFAFTLAYIRCDGKPYVAALAILLAALATAPTWGVRPQMLSLLLMSVYLYVLERQKHVWLLVPLMILWVNLHSGYALGLMLVGAYLLGGVVEHLPDLRAQLNLGSPLGRLALVLALCAAAVLINPNGASMYIYPFETLTSHAMQAYIQEWFSPDFHSMEWQPFAWLLVVTFGAVGLSRKRVGVAQTLLLMVLAYAGLRSARNIPLYAIAAGPVLADHLWALVAAHGAAGVLSPSGRVTRGMSVLNWGVMAVIVAAGLVRIGTVLANQGAVERIKFPVAAVDFLQKQGSKTPLYNAYGWGGYLIWRLYPDQPVFIDGRADVYGDAFIEEFLGAYRGGAGWSAPLDRYHVQRVLVEPDAPIAAHLAQDATWTKTYADPQAVIFERR